MLYFIEICCILKCESFNYCTRFSDIKCLILIHFDQYFHIILLVYFIREYLTCFSWLKYQTQIILWCLTILYIICKWRKMFVDDQDSRVSFLYCIIWARFNSAVYVWNMGHSKFVLFIDVARILFWYPTPKSEGPCSRKLE